MSSATQYKQKQVHNLSETMSNMGNPFLDDCPELIVLNTRNCAGEDVVATVQKIESLGQSQYTDVITSRKVSIHKPI